MRLSLVAVLIPLVLLVGCGGGNPASPGDLVVGEIQGLDLVEENTSAQYSVTASGDTGITYHWTVEPDSLGSFTNPNSPTTTFNAGEVTEDTAATVRVVVISDNGGPVSKTKRITILNTPVNELTVGEIQGPDAADENTSVEYSVTALGDTGITYQWMINPLSAGMFENAVLSTVTLDLAEVEADTKAGLQVIVNSDNSNPEVRSRNITVLDVPPSGLQVSGIIGPTEMTEYSTEWFAVSATGDSGITFSWTCDPSHYGMFASPHERETTFSVVGFDFNTQVLLEVEVDSDNYDPEQRQLLVQILNSYDPAAYIGAGHPMEGINYRRNNRSTHLLPSSLDGDESVLVPLEQKYGWKETYSSLVVGPDDRLYLGTYFHWEMFSTDYGESHRWRWIRAFQFGEDFGEKHDGGLDSVLTSEGLFTSSRSDGGSFNGYGGMLTGGHDFYASVIHYGVWPNTIASVTDTWSVTYSDIGNYWQNEDTARRFEHVLPLPDGRLIVSFARNDFGPTYLQVLDESFNVLDEHNLDSHLRGLAFDRNTGVTYVGCDAGLYAYNWDFNEKWNSTVSVPDFSDVYPVIGDDGAIYGCREGMLVMRIEPDGSAGPSAHCGAYLWPVVLSDGTIGVITGSNIALFDPLLNRVGDIPLPTGINTGDQYIQPPLVDADDNMALYTVRDLYIINRNGAVLDQRTFDGDIRAVRLGPNHLFVLAEGRIYRFPN